MYVGKQYGICYLQESGDGSLTNLKTPARHTTVNKRLPGLSVSTQ